MATQGCLAPGWSSLVCCLQRTTCWRWQMSFLLALVSATSQNHAKGEGGSSTDSPLSGKDFAPTCHFRSAELSQAPEKQILCLSETRAEILFLVSYCCYDSFLSWWVQFSVSLLQWTHTLLICLCSSSNFCPLLSLRPIWYTEAAAQPLRP